MALVFGTPVLLFVLLALSVDVIEYAPRAPSSSAIEEVSAAHSDIGGEQAPKWVVRENPRR